MNIAAEVIMILKPGKETTKAILQYLFGLSLASHFKTIREGNMKRLKIAIESKIFKNWQGTKNHRFNRKVYENKEVCSVLSVEAIQAFDKVWGSHK